MYDVAIIGAGIIGAMTARELARYELKICVLEKESDVALGATKANSAIVHAGFDAKEGSLKAKLNVQGAKLMEQTARELGVKYIKNGSLVIGFDENDEKQLELLLERGKANGTEDLEIVRGERLKQLEPNISDSAVCALWAPTGAIICPYELALAAMGNAMDNGAELETDFEVSQIRSEQGSYMLCSNDGREICAKFVVNAAGLYSDKVAQMIGDRSFKVHPRKGEYILLDKKCGNLARHTIFRTPSKMGKGILVTPTVDGNLLLGPTSVDTEDKSDKDTTAQGFTRIIKEAAENIKGIPFNKTITSFCGLRAVGDTGDFIINSPKERFINAAGIESPGLSASPAIARLVCQMLWEQGLDLAEKSDFIKYRAPMHAFREASIEEKNEIIKKDRSFGKIVCRCEGITEGEILQAIRTNPKARDMDGVKRRTRAQMGRCQGGFCSPYIAELIAKELDIPYEKVTKSGKGSYILTGKTKGE